MGELLLHRPPVPYETFMSASTGPEAWALKYFASATLLSGLEPPDPPELRRIGAITLGLEVNWMPTLDAGQQRVGFNGTAPEGLN